MRKQPVTRTARDATSAPLLPSSGSSPANVDPSGPDAKSWELIRIAYEAHFELARHYSSIMFQARITITTAMVLAVAVGFGYVSTVGSGQIEWAGISARGLVAYVAALLLNLLYAMEVTYVVRFYRIVHSGRRIEREYGAPGYFAGFERANSWPLYFAYLGGIIVLVGLFIGAAWVRDQSAGRSIVLMIAASLPVASFIWSYAGLVRSGRALLDSDEHAG